MIGGVQLIDRLTSAALDFAGQASSPAKLIDPAASFAAALGETANRAVATLEQAEAVSLKALQGEAETREVVDAVMSAEQTLQTAIAIRDKIVTAYLELSRMQI